jgi:hypothetical protein
MDSIGIDNLLGAAVELALEQGLSISPPFQSAADRWIDSLAEGKEQPVLSADDVAENEPPDFDEDEDEDEDFEEAVEEGGRGLK